jgi:hypothetical protein
MTETAHPTIKFPVELDKRLVRYMRDNVPVQAFSKEIERALCKYYALDAEMMGGKRTKNLHDNKKYVYAEWRQTYYRYYNEEIIAGGKPGDTTPGIAAVKRTRKHFEELKLPPVLYASEVPLGIVNHARQHIRLMPIEANDPRPSNPRPRRTT